MTVHFSVLLLLGLVGCGADGTNDSATTAPDDGGGTTDSDTDDTDTVPDDTDDTDTDTETTTDAAYPKPTLLEALCTADVNPLQFSCDVTVEPAQPVQISFVRADGIGVERTFTSELESTLHTIPLYFMGPEHDYTLEVTATTWPDEPPFVATVTTGQPPFDVGSWLTMTGTSTMGLIGTDLPCGSDAIATIYDTTTGDLVWFRNIDPQGALGLLDMVRFTDDKTIIGETGGSVVEEDLLGNDIVRFDVNYGGVLGVHHDIFKWNDQFYVMYQQDFGAVTMDMVVILDLVGNEVGRWNPNLFLDIPPNANSQDYLHTNTIYVDASGDIYLSFLAQSSLAKIEGDLASPDFGIPQWILTGDPAQNDIGFDMTVDWSLIDGNNGFGFQHNLHLRNDGRLMVLDNDGGRALVMTIDEVAKTATVDVGYDTAESSCGPQGTAMETKAGNAVVACSTDTVREYDLATSAMVWEAVVECRNGGTFGGASATRWYPLDSW